jgi:hypothetical protein
MQTIRHHFRHCATLWLTVLFIVSPILPANATEPMWQTVAYKAAEPVSLQTIARKQYALFHFFLQHSLSGSGQRDFEAVSQQVRNNIHWRDNQGRNAYNEAFRRSFPFIKRFDLQGMPDTVLLIPYMESQWHGKKGNKSADYGYWQLVPEVIREIQTLDYVAPEIRQANIDSVRANAFLSTRAAQVHLHRYYFYFAKVAGFSESDSWLFTLTAFNWGAGNVKRALADMQQKGIPASYSNFYHYLYRMHQSHPGDKSLTAAVEYVPSLWNIAGLIKESN